jgi:hypothetical protein
MIFRLSGIWVVRFSSSLLCFLHGKNVSLLITITIAHCATLTLVYSIYDSTKAVIQEMVEASQRMINEHLNSPPVNEHFK